MNKKYITVGKIVSTHGLKGFVRVQAWCDNNEFLTGFKDIYFDENGIVKKQVTYSFIHGNVVLMKFKGIDSISDAENLRNTVIYIDRNDCNLDENRYFISDIVGCEVIDANTGENYGTVSDVEKYKANDIWYIKKGENTYVFPAVDEFIESVDIDNSLIKVKPIKGIFDNED